MPTLEQAPRSTEQAPRSAGTEATVPAGAPANRETKPPVVGEVLIASHGGASGAGAIRLGCGIAGRWHAPAEIMGVVTPFAMYPPEVVIDSSVIEEAERRSLLGRITAQAEAVGQSGVRAPISVMTGGPADVIVDVAMRHHASLVVVGLGRRDLMDRLLGGQTPVQVLRRASVPVLAAAADAGHVLKTLVIATDFSESAESAARMALALVADDAAVYLVHVRPEVGDPMREPRAPEVWRRVIDEGTTALIERLRQSLPEPPRGAIRPIFLRGDPAHMLSRFATEVHADLIAVGSHGRGFAERVLLGSVAEALLRSAHCSVLVVPARTMASAARWTSIASGGVTPTRRA